MINFKEFEKHISFESAFIIPSYPYGFKRTKKAIWIETKGNKQRVGERTLNPKSQAWNNTKYSTYSDLILMFKQETTGFIKTYHFNLAYSSKEEEFKRLLEALGDYRTPYIETLLKLSQAVYKTQEFIEVEIREVPYNETQEEKEKHKAEQEAIKKDINKLFVVNALNEGLKPGEF